MSVLTSLLVTDCMMIPKLLIVSILTLLGRNERITLLLVTKMRLEFPYISVSCAKRTSSGTTVFMISFSSTPRTITCPVIRERGGKRLSPGVHWYRDNLASSYCKGRKNQSMKLRATASNVIFQLHSNISDYSSLIM